MAKLLGENEFATQFHEGEKANIHIHRGQPRHPGGDLRLPKLASASCACACKKASEELGHIFEALLKKVPSPGADSPFAEITDEDIDNLFND